MALPRTGGWSARRVASHRGPRPGSRSSQRRHNGDEEEAEENVACPGVGVLRGLSGTVVCWAVGGGRADRGLSFSCPGV